MIYIQHITLFCIFVRLEINWLLTWKVYSLQTLYWPCPAKQQLFTMKTTKKSFLFLAHRVLQLMTVPKWPSFPFLKMARVMILTRSCYLTKSSWLVLDLASVTGASIMTLAISVSPTKHSFGASQWITTKRSIHSLVRKNTEFIIY